METASNKSIWIARNRDGSLEVWKRKPYPGVKAFTTDNDLSDWIGSLDDDMYPEVTWENSPKELTTMGTTTEDITVRRGLAYKCAEALIEQHNNLSEQQKGSVRLMSFRTLYANLVEMGFKSLITGAIRPDDYPKEMWFSNPKDSK